MRKFTLLWLFLLCTTFNSFAQEISRNSQEKNEIGLSIFGIHSEYGFLFSPDFYFSVFNGIYYKRHFGLNSLRMGLHSRDASERVSGNISGTSHYQENKFMIGYQRTFLKKSIKPYLGFDLIYNVAKFQEESSGGFTGIFSKKDLNENGFGFAPLLGINVLLFNSVSLSFESNFEFLYISSNGTGFRSQINDFGHSITYEIHDDKHQKLVNPLKSLSLNYTF